MFRSGIHGPVMTLPPPVEWALCADPTLDADVAAWFDHSTPRPKVRVLGPVTVAAPGPEPERKRALCTELVTYLATREAGVTAGDLSAAIWPEDQQPTPGYRRTVLSLTRRWLGGHGGRLHLPHRYDGADRHLGTYALVGVLLDWQLFRRLRTRAAARDDPRLDLVSALRLVAGAPFDATRVRGYGWLVQEGLGHLVFGAVLDAAHRLVDLSLAAGDVPTAAWAAERARACDPRQLADTPLVDSARVAVALGDGERARSLVRHLVHLREGAVVEEDLAPATFAALDALGLIPAH